LAIPIPCHGSETLSVGHGLQSSIAEYSTFIVGIVSMGHPLKHTETDDLDEAWKKENKHENNKKNALLSMLSDAS
jgi:hypothetical protein